jgi:hypothetical protein
VSPRTETTFHPSRLRASLSVLLNLVSTCLDDDDTKPGLKRVDQVLRTAQFPLPATTSDSSVRRPERSLEPDFLLGIRTDALRPAVPFKDSRNFDRQANSCAGSHFISPGSANQYESTGWSPPQESVASTEATRSLNRWR